MQDPYTDAWLQLNQVNLKAVTGHPALAECKLSFSAALKYFAEHAHAKIINLRALTKPDEIYLASKAISTRYLIRNLKKTIKRNYRDSWAFQLNAVRKKVLYAICPFGGTSIESVHSLLANINTIFYRFESQQVFYVVIAGIGHGFEKKAIYFPNHELIVTTGDSYSFEEEDLVELKARMVSNFTLCLEYLSNQDKGTRKTLLCLGFYHFAHHLWNELSGVYRLHKRNLLKDIDKIMVMREPLGPLEWIFPEIPEDKIDRQNTAGGIFNEILSNHYFAIRVGDRSVASDLAARVYKVALDNCLPATHKEVDAAREKHSPLLWVGIRIGNRTWVDQAIGLAKLINSLSVEFPRLGIVFDGFSLPADRSSLAIHREEYTDIIYQENAVVNAVVEMLPHDRNGIGVFNIIGSSIFDANVWAHAIDVYVSPFGTLQHKVGWLTNKPGIIHANHSILENPLYLYYVWATVENGVMPRYVRYSSVTDIHTLEREAIPYKQLSDYNSAGAGVQATDKRVQTDLEFDNYSVEWQPLLDDLSDLIRSRKSLIKLSRPGLVYGVAWKLRNTLRGITGFFDTSKT